MTRCWRCARRMRRIRPRIFGRFWKGSTSDDIGVYNSDMSRVFEFLVKGVVGAVVLLFLYGVWFVIFRDLYRALT